MCGRDLRHRLLDLSQNSFAEAVPSAFPNTLTYVVLLTFLCILHRCSKLAAFLLPNRYLNLHNNAFNGSIPSTVSAMTGLKYVSWVVYDHQS